MNLSPFPITMPANSAVAGVLDVRIGFHTARGQRAANEDYTGAYLGRNNAERARLGVAMAVADGVGGAKGGRVAAELTVRCFFDAYLSQSELHGIQRNATHGLNALNRWVYAQGLMDAELESMACTFTGLILRGRQAHLIHVGDSRLYRLRDGVLAQLTTDHIPALGGLKHMLTRAIGAEAELRIDYAAESAKLHDRYLICSDGVHGALSAAYLKEDLERRSDPEDCAKRIVEAALTARVGDNATALVADILSLPPPNQIDLELAMAALPIVAPPRAGQVLDGFELRQILSDGRYSRVFRAFDAIGGREVIAKFPKAEVGADAMLRQSFLREAWIAARVESPWIGEVIEVPAERRSAVYTIMPFYTGETLERRLLRAPQISLAAGTAIALKLAKGVASLHKAGIVHRDIKPENVILDDSGGLRLVDLGVARLPNMEDFPPDDAPGTPSYMAPELFQGHAGDEASDLFALGVTLYRLFTRGYPYGEMEPFSHPRFGRATPLSQKRPDLPAWLDQVLSRAYDVAPDQRYGDAVEFIFALENGSIGAAPARPKRQPLYARDPLLFWKLVSALLVFLLALSLTLR